MPRVFILFTLLLAPFAGSGQSKKLSSETLNTILKKYSLEGVAKDKVLAYQIAQKTHSWPSSSFGDSIFNSTVKLWCNKDLTVIKNDINDYYYFDKMVLTVLNLDSSYTVMGPFPKDEEPKFDFQVYIDLFDSAQVVLQNKEAQLKYISTNKGEDGESTYTTILYLDLEQNMLKAIEINTNDKNNSFYKQINTYEQLRTIPKQNLSTEIGFIATIAAAESYHQSKHFKKIN